MTPSDILRFWDKVDSSKEGCWEWRGGINPNGGYGRFHFNNGQAPAHRLSWQLIKGSIPQGLFVLHHCDNPPCVNPSHLYLGTLADNNRDTRLRKRQPKAQWTHCHSNHELTEENTYIRPNGTRCCRECRRRRDRARR